MSRQMHITGVLQKQEQPDRDDKGRNRQHKHPKEDIAGPDHLGYFGCEVPIADNILIELPKGFHCLPKDLIEGIPWTYWMEEELIFSSASKFSFNPPLFKILIITANWQTKPTTIGSSS